VDLMLADHPVTHEHGREFLRHAGTPYIDFMAAIAQTKHARAYLEIGTQTGASLARMNCASIAVDPNFRLKFDPVGSKPGCFMFQMTSDDFFAVCSPKAMLGRPLDLAFLDGLHLFEFLLRDFMNTERSCRQSTIVFLHDCLPPVFEIAGRQDKPVVHNKRFLHHWAGDVWKLIPILARYRPDLTIGYLDCPPTGLVAITNCDPASTILRDSYNDIVKEFAEGPADFPRFAETMSAIKLLPSATLPTAEALEAALGASPPA
jgi:hypothetical protein